MAGIYIHIPFCKQICYYCDFYKSANYRYVEPFIEALYKEISLKRDFTNEVINTIYFGGGTPSSIPIKLIGDIIVELNQAFTINPQAEITFELNPDDVDLKYLNELKLLGIDRLSVGVQSFNDTTLKFLNRRHNADQSKKSIIDANNAGFNNISIDLIYGIPNQTKEKFLQDLNLFLQFKLAHLSAYHLTIVEKTHFGRLFKKGDLFEVKEKQSLEFYDTLIESMNNNSYSHYEISSFALEGKYSKHNMAYWQNVPYIGLGPSAHSYNGNSRIWNSSSVKDYITNIKNKLPYFETEILNQVDKFNEFIITRLRTKMGCDLNLIKSSFSDNIYNHCLKVLNHFQNCNDLELKGSHFSLKEKSLIQSDFYIEKFILEK